MFAIVLFGNDDREPGIKRGTLSLYLARGTRACRVKSKQHRAYLSGFVFRAHHVYHEVSSRPHFGH